MMQRIKPITKQLKNRLSYISKSKMNTFIICPMQFAFNYLTDIEQEPNPYFILGNSIHVFIDTFFDIVKPLSNGELKGISKLTFHPYSSYRKNVVKFEIKRWRAINKTGLDKSYFMPVEKETKWTVEELKIIGIVDRVHKLCSADPFAPKHPKFKDGQMGIIENKTGKPNAEKCKKYENDFYWYKLIIETMRPDLGELKWGVIYFPYNNYVYHCKLDNEKCKELLVDIEKVREKIKLNLASGMWSVKPSKFNCQYCGYRNECESVVR